MTNAVPASRRFPFVRAAVLFLVWLVLTDARLADVPVGLLAAFLGALASRSLAPETLTTPRAGALLSYAVRFLRQSVLAGFDIAHRAFSPSLPLKPGMAQFTPTLPPGPARTLFADLASMAPGTLPTGETADGAMELHCLDTDIDAAAQLADDETRLMAALGLEAQKERLAGS
ncbi:multicomponent Na+:H+ antiporter subunit E [Kaistia hirudinis]|uniref:Multicomponent Na+:H+ antiporter subunit E n=1 Tax=Kaistia hirudinis TaxID=1293440 RepID=A0A840AJZ7_9HYPH|nr:Na+/H+ antiporter subunit E [Kaistia hirudinis]MBB3929474.1 multicomponent Na+:H+ antiporter subunit E [Kaistia hirudinis]